MCVTESVHRLGAVHRGEVDPPVCGVRPTAGCVCVCLRECVCVRESVCVGVRECVCEREKERGNVCVCERERLSVCDRECASPRSGPWRGSRPAGARGSPDCISFSSEPFLVSEVPQYQRLALI